MDKIKLAYNEKILFWLVVLLGFQQFPIIRLGGSLKIYEILGFILVVYNFLKFRIKNRISKLDFFSFFFFIIIPVGSYFYSSFFFEYPYNYYMIFPKANSDFKSGYYLFPLLQIFYMIMNWTVFKGLLDSRKLYENIYNLMKVAIILGTIISLYSLCALYVIDFIPLLPGWIQFKFTKDGTRSTGLSQEPGTYVLYQMWICLFLWYSKKNFKKKWWNILFLINVVSCVLTQSTALWGFVIAILFSLLIFNTTQKTRVNGFLGIFSAIILFYAVIQLLGYGETFYSTFFKKIAGFAVGSGGHKAMGSGAIRKYMSDIGYVIFQHYPFLGVGFGRSMYYMYQFKNMVGISASAEKVNYFTTPLNMFSIIAAEMGIVGLLGFIFFYIAIFQTFWKNRNKSQLHKMFFMGCVVEIGTLFSLYTPHAVFLWAYLALGLGYIKYFDRNQPESK